MKYLGSISTLSVKECKQFFPNPLQLAHFLKHFVSFLNKSQEFYKSIKPCCWWNTPYCYCIFRFLPRHADEIEIEIGDPVYVQVDMFQRHFLWWPTFASFLDKASRQFLHTQIFLRFSMMANFFYQFLTKLSRQFLHPASFPSHHLEPFHLLDAMQISIYVFGFLWICGNFRQHRKSLLQRMLHDYILPFSPKSNIRQKQFQVFIDICPFIHPFSSLNSISLLIDIFQKEADDLWCEGINLRTGQQVCFHGELDIPRIKKVQKKKTTYI